MAIYTFLLPHAFFFFLPSFYLIGLIKKKKIQASSAVVWILEHLYIHPL